MSAPEEALRRLARERGRILGELGASPKDVRWARSEADALSSLLAPALPLRLPGPLERLRRRVLRALR